jgi:S-disulfanyl-L-cysteine oxidoreductase SoxD
MKPNFAVLFGILACAAIPGALHAQSSPSASSGVYTAAQATRGGALFQSKCASCHNADLSGSGTAPALAGPDFLANWVGQPIAALFDSIHTSMPSDNPGTLSTQQVADLIAFILSSNQYRAGQTEIPTDADQLKHIPFDSASPAAAK